MTKSTKCMALLASLLLFSAGVNSIFIGTAAGSLAKQTQQVHREGATPQQTTAVECASEPTHCRIVVR